MRKGDEVDEVNTTDLENFYEGFGEIDYNFFIKNRINLARAFMGYDGGFSLRRLKKMMLLDIKRKKDE